jgi:hypothetical protein
MVRTTDTSRLLDSTARTGRVLGDVSDLDQDIVLLQFGESNLLNRGSLTLRVLRDMSSSVWYGMIRERLWSRDRVRRRLTDWSSTRARIFPGISRDILCSGYLTLGTVWYDVTRYETCRNGYSSTGKQIDRSNLIALYTTNCVE